MKTTKAFRLQEVRQSHTARVYGRDRCSGCAASWVLKQPRTTQRYVPKPADEHTLTERVIELAREYGRYRYRRVTALLRVRAGE